LNTKQTKNGIAPPLLPSNLIAITPHDLLPVAVQSSPLPIIVAVESRCHCTAEYRCRASCRRSSPLPHPCLFSFWFDGCLKTTIKTKRKQTTQSNPHRTGKTLIMSDSLDAEMPFPKISCSKSSRCCSGCCWGRSQLYEKKKKSK
jgi:hypothetical protein